MSGWNLSMLGKFRSLKQHVEMSGLSGLEKWQLGLIIGGSCALLIMVAAVITKLIFIKKTRYGTWFQWLT